MSTNATLAVMREAVAQNIGKLAEELLYLGAAGTLPPNAKVREVAQGVVRGLNLTFGEALSIVTSEIHRCCLHRVAGTQSKDFTS